MSALDDVPITHDFLAGLHAEKDHQVRRWGRSHDSNKSPTDWFWVLGWIAGKAVAAHLAGDRVKAQHRVIAAAAILSHWHDALKGDPETLCVESHGVPRVGG